jgi:predicted nucleic acid-binding protein
MATNARTAVLDSSALISLVNVADQLHDEAVEIDSVMTAAGWLILLPREVFAETINAIGKKISRRDAVLVARFIVDRYDTHDFEFVHAERHVYDRAIALQGHGTGNPSFVDCLVMALADEHQTRDIFGFDATFAKNGYQLPDRSSQRLEAS